MSPTRILVVEDESVIAFDLELQLTSLGYQVVGVAANGKDAVKRADTLCPDIVLMDIHLDGDMDGVEAARWVRERYRIPVVFLTAYAETNTLKRAEASQPYGYLVKPCDGRELHATLQMALVRHAAEAEVEASEERLRLAMDSAGQGIWEWDADSGRMATAGCFDAILERLEDRGGEGLEAFLRQVHPLDRAEMSEALRQLGIAQTQVCRTFRHPRRDGRLAWIEFHAQSRTGRLGKIARIVGMVRDITEQREAEERLRAAAAVFDTTTDGIFIADSAHRIIAVNAAFSRVTGYGESEALGGNPNELLFATPHSCDFYQRLMGIAGGQWQGEIVCRRKDGESFPAWASISVVLDASIAVARYVGVISDISALRHAEERLTQLAYYDAMTGLPNRQLFNDRLNQALARAQRDRLACALMFLDMDGFKAVNDNFGHTAGDQLLREVAKRLQGGLRASDTAARFGGDEFLVLLEDIKQAADAEQVARKFLDALLVPIGIGGQRVVASASIGIAFYPDNGMDAHALLQAADAALYRAKAQGRNRYCLSQLTFPP
jgi:diguanylate cyclase (GGDEF)-like protein/PAS domain S-box-containing protein